MAVMLLIGQGADAQERRRGSNPRYAPGDWISYSTTRYVTSIAIGNPYVYFGTGGGITRYNYFSNAWDYPWTTSNGLADNAVTAVAFDVSTGYLWCATRSGVSYLDPASERWKNLFADEVGIPPFDEVTSIGVSADELWLETRSGRLFRGDKYSGNFFAYVPNPGEPGFNSQTQWFGERAPKSENLPRFFMKSGYLFDPRGEIQDFRLRRYQVTVAAPDPWGRVWLGTWGLGAARGDLRTLRLDLLSMGLAQRDVRAIAVKGNEMWLGGVSGIGVESGITLWNRRRDEWTYYEAPFVSGLTNDQVTSMAIDGDFIWFGTLQGLMLYDRKEDRWRVFSVFQRLLDDQINDVAVDDQSLWVATRLGLNRILKGSIGTDSLQVQRIDFENVGNVEVYHLALQENLLWAATAYGLYIYDTAKDTGGFLAGSEGPVDKTVTAVCGFRNELWVGTIDGIEVYDTARKKWLGVPMRRLYTATPIYCLAADEKAVWAGTDNGVLKYDRERAFWRFFTTEDGLIDNHVRAISIEGDYIWFGTAGGLTRFYWNAPQRVD